MFITVNEDGERVIYDGEALDYVCNDCGQKFERLIYSGCCCPSVYWRKKAILENPTVCPKCNSCNVERIRNEKYAKFMEIAMGRKLYEWEN